MTGEEKGSVAISGRSSHKMTGLKLQRRNWKERPGELAPRLSDKAK